MTIVHEVEGMGVIRSSVTEVGLGGGFGVETRLTGSDGVGGSFDITVTRQSSGAQSTPFDDNKTYKVTIEEEETE